MTLTPERSVITIATTNKVFVDMACNLAMSFLLWNDTNKIRFYLITDCPQYVPQKLKNQIDIVSVPFGSLGSGFSTKLNMDHFGFTRQVLFIDADCLVYGSLEPAFEKFKGKAVSAVGLNIYGGKDVGFCNDVKQVMANTGVSYFPLLCGSIYYFESGQISKNIFDHARYLLKSYYDIGLVGLRGKENEEPLMAIAMAKFNQQLINDDGRIKADRMFYQFLKANVIEGNARLWNEDKIPVPEYSTVKLSNPAIVHFNAHYAENHEYESEVIRLRQVFIKGNSKLMANSLAILLAVAPGKIRKTAKDILRPFYHAVFGFRKIKTLKRM